jgi:hypothetical protein
MRASVTGVRSELGSILAPRLAMAATKHVHIIAGQQANSLLHDGHAWKDFARTALAGTRRAMRLSRTDGASMLVHASFAFVHAVERGAVLTDPLRSAADAIPECEALALSGPVPACVVRLGYLYGPTSADLLASNCVSSWPALLVGPAQGAAVPPPPVRCRLGIARCYQDPEHGNDRLRNRRSRDFVYAVHGRVRTSGRSANATAFAVVLEASRQGHNSRGTHAADGAPGGIRDADAAREGMEAEVSGLSGWARSGHMDLGQLR